MELNFKRHLHEHALPVVMLAVALTILSAACLGYYQHGRSYTEAQLGRALFSPLVHVNPKANGLAQISVGSSDQTNPLGSAANAGQATGYSFSFNNQ
jgi:hypothetical protein